MNGSEKLKDGSTDGSLPEDLFQLHFPWGPRLVSIDPAKLNGREASYLKFLLECQESPDIQKTEALFLKILGVRSYYYLRNPEERHKRRVRNRRQSTTNEPGKNGGCRSRPTQTKMNL